MGNCLYILQSGLGHRVPDLLLANRNLMIIELVLANLVPYNKSMEKIVDITANENTVECLNHFLRMSARSVVQSTMSPKTKDQKLSRCLILRGPAN